MEALVSLRDPVTGPRCCSRNRSGRRRAGVPVAVGIACCAACVCSLASAQEVAAPATIAPTPSGESRQPGPTVKPPEVLKRVDALYPPEAVAARREAIVWLQVTVDASGAVTDVAVSESGGPDFDQAAISAARAWRFRPAFRGEEAVPSRIKVPFRFVLPRHDPPPQGAPPPPASPALSTPLADESAAPPPQTALSPRPNHEVIDVAVYGRRASPPRATSDFVVDRDVLAAAPHQSAGDLLSSAPGIYVSRPEGEAVAHQVYLRGFDAEHGQDIQFTVGAVPVNEPSQIHGQGYADLNFIIPEVVRSLRVTEGVFDPRQGDFAVAGSVDFDLGVAERGYQLRSSIGSFGTFRELLIWAPPGAPEETFGAVAIRRSQGFGQNRGSLAGSTIGQYAFAGPAGSSGLVHIAAAGSRASLAGVLRLDDVQAGRVGFYDSYPDVTANAQSAFGSRTQLAVTLDAAAEGGARTGIAAWLLLTNFRLRENFTGYTQRSEQMPEWVGRGDLIEEENHDIAAGGRFYHRTSRVEPWSWLGAQGELGLSFRTDLIEQAANLLEAPQNQTWDRRVDASVRGSDLGAYVDADLRLGRHVHLRGGARADVLYYDIDDRLGNFTPLFQRATHMPGFRRTALGVAAGPRATLEVTPRSWLTFLGSYGEGYRSPQARQLEEGENAPFAKVRSLEAGARLRPGDGRRLTLTLAGYATFLSYDLAFDPSEGALTKIGPTSRKGAVVQLTTRPCSGRRFSALASLSVTYVRATLDQPPPATAENPSPPYQPGELLPNVPPVVARADLALTRHLVAVHGHVVEGRLGAGYTYLSPRPLPYGQFGDPVNLLDVSLGARWRWLDLGLDVWNLAGVRYAGSEYSFVSDWGTRQVASLLPARHFSAGAPRTFLGTLGLSF